MRSARYLLPVAALIALAAVVGLKRGGSPAEAETSPQYGPYLLHRPANLSRAKPVPLVVVIHGFGSSPSDMQRATQFSTAADRYGFVVVYPDITKGTYTDLAVRQGPDNPPLPDIQFLGSLIDKIKASENIDPDRVLMTGLSAGAGLSYRSACQLSDKVRAIAPVSAGDVWPTCRPARPVALYAIRGANDPFSPEVRMQATLDHWRRVDGCTSRTTTQSVGSATVQTWQACKSSTSVAGAVIAGGTHTWPGAPGIPGASPDAKFDATTEMWKFFAGLTTQHPLQRLLAVVPRRGPLSLSRKQVSQGSFLLTVDDRSRTRNFHFVGVGVNRRTTSSFVGTARWTVALTPGLYRFGSDKAGLKGRLLVH